MTCHLSVNVNAIAQLRNRRNLPWPSVTGLSRVALDAGASGITVHPRPDERHIRRSDVADLEAMLRADYPKKEFNIEGYPTADFLALVERHKPDQVTLVPDDPSQATSDHGWDIAAHEAMLTRVIGELHDGGMRVSLFVDADPAAALLARQVGADRVELYTGPYGSGVSGELDRLRATGEAARACGLGLNAGHDLTRANLPPLVAALPFMDEVSIGHALTADCLMFGMAETVRLYLEALRR
ncbi:MAG: pyridoxine 5'-phosphate synthase [Aestuariivirgaceae bacterium]|nr:pyridoxine 5'-phosphate synthase [Aestuariivirgaceae bacterium]